MLLEEFETWRSSKNHSCHIHLDCDESEWNEDFGRFILSRYSNHDTAGVMIDLAYQIYMLQICCEGFIGEIEDLQEQLDSTNETVANHEDWIDKVSI
jgi:hypothetical protein